LSKKQENFSGLTKKIYEMIAVNGTTKYLIKETGKSKTSVGKVLTKLLKQNKIKRVYKGYYVLSKKNGTVAPVIQNDTREQPKSSELLQKSDFLRLHDVQVKLRINSDDQRKIRRLVLKKKMFKNIRSAGNNDTWHFNVDKHVGLFQIGRQNIHLTFPSDWEIVGNDIQSLASQLYDVVEDQVTYLENIMHSNFYKDNRINFEITKNHVALVNNGVVKEMKLSGIRGLSVYDEIDGKQRFLMDWSKGRPELEAVHTVHALDDADKAQYFMETLKDGEYEDMHKNAKDFFGKGPENKSELVESNINAQNNISEVTKLLKASIENNALVSGETSKSFLEIAKMSSNTVLGMNKLAEQNQHLVEQMGIMTNNINNLAGTISLLAQDKLPKPKKESIPSYIY